MSELSIQTVVSGDFDQVCSRVTEGLKTIGFGILTRIDFDQKIKERLDKKINRCAILGACNPQLALEAYQQSSDVALFIPCNVVVTARDDGKIQVEAMRPLRMLDFAKGVARSESIVKAESDLERVIRSL